MLQPFAERCEALAELRWEVSVTFGDGVPCELHCVPQRLLLTRQRPVGLQRIHFAVALRRDEFVDRCRQCVLQILLAGELQKRFHALRCQRVAAERQPLVANAQQIQRDDLREELGGHPLMMHQQHHRLPDVLLRFHANHRLEVLADLLVVLLQIRLERRVDLDRQHVDALEAALDAQCRNWLLARAFAQTVVLVRHDRIPILGECAAGDFMDRDLHRSHQRMLVALLFLLALAENVHVDDVDLGDVGEVEVLAPEQQIRFQLHRCAAVERLVEADFAEIFLLWRQRFRFVDPHLERVVGASSGLSVRLNRLAQAVYPQITLLTRPAAVIALTTRSATHLEAVSTAQH